MATRKSAGAGVTVRDPDPSGATADDNADGSRHDLAGASRPAVDQPPAEHEFSAGEGDTVDMVTFVVEGEMYAFPMERVEEIIRMPRAIRVPLGPPGLEGLANLRGRVLPIVSLRSCCGLPVVEHDEATRVIVVDGGATLGFVVDRVASVTSVEASLVEAAERIGGAIDSELLAGVIKPGHREEDQDGELVKVLDVARLVATQFAMLADRTKRALTDGVAGSGSAVEPSDEADDDTLELVSFAVDGQEYALPIDRVQEIVQAPERVTTVPNAEARVLGVMNLRGRLLPVVSLRQVFGLAPAPLAPQNRIVVVQLPGQGSSLSSDGGVVGVVMDTVREVLRVPQHLVANLPEFMARAGRAHEVEAVCRLEEGSRLVSVLSVERMFAQGELRSALVEVIGDGSDQAEEEANAMVGEAGRQVNEGEDELLVVFRLAAEEYSVDVDAVQEIIRVPDMLIRVPKALDFVEGLVNLRGAVLPVVDLRTRLGLSRTERDDRQRIIVLIVNGVRTGFIVDSVTEVLRVARGDLEPAPELSQEQSHLVSRVANLAGSQRMLMMLEQDNLLATDQLAALIPHPREVDQGVLVG
jgi:purine-binding chemotaxis protein CheW